MMTNTARTTTPTSRDAVIAAWAAFASRDRGKVASVFTEDAEWLAPVDNPAARSMDGVHHFVGREEVTRFIIELFPLVFVSDVEIVFRGIHEAGDTVVVEETMTATLRHGGHYENDYCFIFELEDGLVSRVREYMDTQRGAAWFAHPQPRR